MNDENTATIEIQDLNKEYKMYSKKIHRLTEILFPFLKKHSVFKAMNNFNLTVNKGEILGIVGRNGAGKSTLLKMITGVVTPTSGTIKVNGKISSLLELGTAFNMELTGYENIYQHGQVMGLTNEEIKEKEQEIIDFADIGEHINQPVKTYSSGMFARLAFACAINVDPDILIVDEVLSVGDMSFQLKCFKKFEEFKRKGKTILFVTHSISDVLANCTRTIILKEGNKIFDGPVKEGVDTYKKLITGMLKINEPDSKQENSNYVIKNDSEQSWKKHFNQNENLVEYGNGKATVIDYGVFSSKYEYLNVIENDKEVILKSKIHFNENVSNPIFTMTIKSFQGVEITGTNTLIEKVYTGNFKKGEEVECEFKQILPLAPNKYTLSFSCTKFDEKGELEILNRKYDALLVEVISTKQCVGMVSLDTVIDLKKI